ncbi:N-acetylmuramoyl-L-alanine amidase [Streptomyces sp. ISL-36]|uniref:N-acetylmuramoyl-L-alanine amidase n=1 Tax=Streptomyces sp. ISL-36 TaxID=2819182 RepID=UPI001BE93BDE|nr:N-acetylmuramoyl-L-alanine amidase [Streptomyces sp. ISL-36]MBT2440452.1 N-acetylmuramoyl-L-alanine amidase [Streptomyces sp. ISL-36]
MSQGHRRDRKKRRLLYGAAAAVVATATIGTIAVASPGVLGSEDGKNSGNASLQSQFAEAAREFDVPQSVLMAVSYRQTRWESHDGEPSVTGAYNVMGLTDVDPEDIEAEADEHRLEHMNRSGDPAVEKKFNAAKALSTLPKETVDTDDPRLHTLDKAAELIDSSAESLKDDTAESIRAGAALLAEYQKQATGELPDEPGQWYPAVARFSQAPDKKGAALFANRVFESIKTGEQALTTDGQHIALPADPSVEPVKPSNVPLAATFASTTRAPATECPTGLQCDFRPAAYSQNDGNYNIASRPANGFDIRQIIIHDTEGGYEGSLAVFQNPASYASAHYLIRASDGLVTQMVETKNEAWHAGNKTANMHSIGIEHEGYAIKAGSWYTEPQYESSAAVVKFLANKYGIPLDRQHIIAHDEIPGVLDAKVRGMHWDPGPFWDWNHYMSLMGAPTGAGGAGGPLKAGQLVRVVPPFTTANQPTLTYGGNAVATQPANFGYLYTTPVADPAYALQDAYLGTQTWSEGPNWANKVVAGGEYVVAEARTDWTAIWYGGQKAWFRNPGGQFTSPVGTTQTVLTAKDGATSVPVYGRAYPEDAAYAGTGVPVQSENNAYLTKYKLPAGQAYAKAGPAAPGDYYYSAYNTNGTRVEGKTNIFIPIRFNHRLVWVKASDVKEIGTTAPDAGTDRYNLIARDSSGALWQYQGTGTASAPFYARYRVGSGWQAYNLVTPLTALRADGTGDVIAREPSGALWYYPGSGNPSGPFKPRVKAGTGWGVFNQVIGVRDQTGDGKPDVIGRESSGVLWLYPGTGNPSAPLGPRLKVGTGWQTYNMIVSTGDLTGDGKPDVMARDSAGALWLYNGTGTASAPFGPRVKIGTGWQTYNTIVGPSDLNRDGRTDVIARDGSGALWLYTGSGNASAPFPPRIKVGSGWQIYNMIF